MADLSPTTLPPTRHRPARDTRWIVLLCLAAFPVGGEIGLARPVDRAAGQGLREVAAQPEMWSGRIVAQESLQPIPGVRITVRSSGADLADAAAAGREPTGPVAVADADGLFEIEAARGARLELSAEGFLDGFVELTPAHETDLGPLVLRQEVSLSLSGCLIQGDLPAAGARILALYSTGSDEGTAAPPPETVADENGCFRLGGIPPRQWRHLVIVTDGIAQSFFGFVRGLDARPYELGDIDIAPVRRLIGRVVDARGRAVAGATVWPSPDDSPLLAPEPAGWRNLEHIPPATTISDSTGRFELSAFAGVYTLFAFKNGLAPTRERIQVEARETPTEVGDIVLYAGLPVGGRVVDSAGAPLAGAQVSFQAMYGWPSLYWGPVYWVPPDPPVVHTDGNGCFVFPGMLPGMRPELRSELAGYVGTTSIYNVPDVPNVESPGPCGGSGIEIEMSRAGGIHGTVVDQYGQPVPDAEVFFQRVESVPNGARSGPPLPTTDAEGTFEISELVPGDYQLDVWEYGYFHARMEGIAVAPGETTAVVVEMTRIADRRPLEVRVYDHRGAPLPDARVTASIQSGSLRSRTGPPLAVTGADGRVRYPDVPLAAYEIRAAAEGVRSRAAWRSSSSLGSDSAPVVLRLPPPTESPAFPVSGRVLDAEGEGVSAAHLRLKVNEIGGEELATISEAGGEFRFDAVPPGRYLLKATRRGFPEVLHEVVLDVASPGMEGVVVKSSVAGTIRGRVAGLPESGARGLRVNATSTGPLPADVRQSISGTGWVGANGGFRITGLAPGRWHLAAKASSGRSAETTVSIERPGQDVEAILEFPPAFTLTGRVLWRGSPLESALVVVASAVVRDRSAIADDHGHFTIPELKPDLYGISIYLRGAVFFTGRTIDLDGDDFVEIQIRGGSVTGQLLDADSGEPVAGAHIRANALGHHGLYNWVDRTDRAGRFRLRPIAAGRWQLEITAPGYARRRPVIEVGNEDIDGVRIELQPSAGLRLRFQAPASTMAGGLDLMWQDLVTGEVLWRSTVGSWQRLVDPGFVWEEVPLGRGVLTVTSDETPLAARFVVTNEGEPVQVLLRDAGSLHLTVAALDNDPTIPASLRLYDEDGLEVAWRGKTRFDRIKYGERAGQFIIRRLSPGKLRAEVTAADGRSWGQQIEIQPRELTTVVLR